MTSRVLSVALLSLGFLCVVAGVWLAFGVGIALIAAGLLLFAAEWLVR